MTGKTTTLVVCLVGTETASHTVLQYDGWAEYKQTRIVFIDRLTIFEQYRSDSATHTNFSDAGIQFEKRVDRIDFNGR